MYVVGIRRESINGPGTQLICDADTFQPIKFTKAEADQVKLEHICEGYPEDYIMVMWLDTGDVEEKPKSISTISVDVVSNIEQFRSFVDSILRLANDPSVPGDVRLKLVDSLNLLERWANEAKHTSG